MKTKIKLCNMKFHAYHGVLPQERIIGTDFMVNLQIEADLNKATVSDNVADTINYAKVYDIVKEEITVPSDLIEHVAGRIYTRLKEHFIQITDLEVRVAKLNPPMEGEIEKAEIVVRG